MKTYTIKELELLNKLGYIKKPILRYLNEWFNGYELLSDIDDSYTPFHLFEISSDCSNTDVIEFLRRYNYEDKPQNIRDIYLPIRSDYSFMFRRYIKGDYREKTYTNFSIRGKHLNLTSHGFVGSPIKKVLSLTTAYEYILSLCVVYPEVKELYDDWLVSRVMQTVAGDVIEDIIDSHLTITNNIIFSDVNNDVAWFNTLTSLGLVYIRRSDYSVSNSLNMWRNHNFERVIPDKSNMHNILKIVPLMFHSIDVVDKKAKIWVICEISIDNGSTLYGRLPLRYCCGTILEKDMTLQVSTVEGTICVAYNIMQYLDSSFTLDEVFDIAPSYSDTYKETLLASLSDGLLQ